MIVVIEIFVAVLVTGLLILTTLTLWFGILGAFGVVEFGRCDSCGHFKLTSQSKGPHECARCRRSPEPRLRAALQHSRIIHHSSRG